METLLVDALGVQTNQGDMSPAAITVMALERASRAAVGHIYPMPGTAHNMIFAASESGEVADAEMRNHPDYVRNNQRPPDVAGEVGQVLSQLASALITIETETPPEGVDIAEMTHSMADMHLALARMAWAMGQRGVAVRHIRRSFAAFEDYCAVRKISPVDAVGMAHAKRLARIDAASDQRSIVTDAGV